MNKPFKRILLKLSGESLTKPGTTGIDSDYLEKMAHSLFEMQSIGIQVGVVIGGGNLFRGLERAGKSIPRSPADQIGMLATMMNGLALQQVLQSLGTKARVFSALDCPKAVESFSWKAANEALDQGEIVLFVGGTGNPYFTTDTAAALRASEIEADALFKATKVDGVYDKDPMRFDDAKKYDRLTYNEALSDNLQVMDAAAIALCRNSRIPIYVFNMNLLNKENLHLLFKEQTTGTLVTGE